MFNQVLVEEHNTDNLHELHRVISEHPSNEKDTVIKYERLLGQLAPLRAFGDLRLLTYFYQIRNYNNIILYTSLNVCVCFII